MPLSIFSAPLVLVVSIAFHSLLAPENPVAGLDPVLIAHDQGLRGALPPLFHEVTSGTTPRAQIWHMFQTSRSSYITRRTAHVRWMVHLHYAFCILHSMLHRGQTLKGCHAPSSARVPLVIFML
jgi:hypothetical protein